MTSSNNSCGLYYKCAAAVNYYTSVVYVAVVLLGSCGTKPLMQHVYNTVYTGQLPVIN